MSNTRIAKPGAPLRQERFVSSPEFDRGLMANLVAKRCEVLDQQADRELIWFVQMLSHQKGGLGLLSRELLAKFPDEIATPAMRKFGMRPGQFYTHDQVKSIRSELPGGERIYPLKGELNWMDLTGLPRIPSKSEDPFDELRSEAIRRHNEAEQRAELLPNSYPVEEFIQRCSEAANSGLAGFLVELCLNPEIKLDGPGPWYFRRVLESLKEFKADWVGSRSRQQTVTELGRMVYATLEYSLEGRCMTVIDGMARTGKTHAVKAWCDINPGKARYVQVPSYNDDIGFFREIAKAVGVSINLNSKAQELRQRIEDTLQGGNLLVVFDEAHYLWPNGNYRLALPGRLNWILTALVNKGVPVCLVTTPQFFKSQKAVEKRTHWTSEQFIGRIGHYQRLPDSLGEDDLFAVARAILPEGDKGTLELLVRYAQGSAKYLAAIETAARRARFLAGMDGRKEVTKADVKRAITESVIPSDSALAQALEDSAPPRRRQKPGGIVPAPAPMPEREIAPMGGSSRHVAPPEFQSNRIRQAEPATI
ncbi:MAG TPA: ATP-binding protein [Clostridia bacterium]|nr:ATP-binding protein [Clostridia bacterium]